MRLVFWGLVIAGLVVLGVRWLAGQGRETASLRDDHLAARSILRG